VSAADVAGGVCLWPVMHFEIFISADKAQCIDISLLPRFSLQTKKSITATKGAYEGSIWSENNIYIYV